MVTNTSCDCLTSGFSAIVDAFTFADSAVSGAFASFAAGDGLAVSILSSFAVFGVGSYISWTDSVFASGASTAGVLSASCRLAALSGAIFEAGRVYSVVGCSAFADPLSAGSSMTAGASAAGSGT